MKETDLFPPLKTYLETHGYRVNAEVANCDIVATKDDEMVIVEMKTAANLGLLIQAVERQQICDSVYVAIPRPKSGRRQFAGLKRVLRSLELGLLIVEQGVIKDVVSKVFDPKPPVRRKNKRRQRRVIREVENRVGEFNIGGSNKTQLMTAYRQQSILIATCLEKLGPTSIRALRKMGTGDKTADILQKNHYGWFERVHRGTYQLTAAGEAGLGEFAEVRAACLKQLNV